MTCKELKVSDIYSSYLDDINRLQEENKELVTKCNQLEKKLEIATKALEEIRDDMTSNDVYNDVPCDISEKALEQMQEVK